MTRLKFLTSQSAYGIEAGSLDGYISQGSRISWEKSIVRATLRSEHALSWLGKHSDRALLWQHLYAFTEKKPQQPSTDIDHKFSRKKDDCLIPVSLQRGLFPEMTTRMIFYHTLLGVDFYCYFQKSLYDDKMSLKHSAVI